MSELTDISARLLALACDAGADQAVAAAAETTGLDASVRDGELEEIGRSESLDIGLRVIVGQRQACVSASSKKTDALQDMAIRAVAMAREAPDDPYCGLATAEQLATDLPDLQLCDPAVPDPNELRDDAMELDAVARGVPGVSKMESTGAHWRQSTVAVVQSNGFSASRRGSFWSAEAVAIAGEGLGMERDYAFSTARWREDRRALPEIAEEAAERATRRLAPKHAETGQVPVILDQRVASSIVGHLLGAINGASVARGSTFLRDRMGQTIFPENITIVEDPRRLRGVSSRAHDGEGLPTRERALVSEGVLQGWLLDLATARQLGLESTASASFGIGSVPYPSASNVTLSPGTDSPEDLIAGIDNGMLVTELIGASINSTTGDYSRGAIGFWIEKGEIAYPVTEATLVGNLNEIFRQITPADDLPKNRSLRVPTLRLDGCTIAGS